MVTHFGRKRARTLHGGYDPKRILDAGKYVRHVDIVNLGAPASQVLGCLLQGIDGFRKRLVPIQRSADPDADTFEFGWRYGWPSPGNDCLQRCDVTQVAGEQADRVETGTQMPDPTAIDSGKARLEAEYAAEGRWQDGRPASLRTDRNRNHVIGDRGGRPA